MSVPRADFDTAQADAAGLSLDDWRAVNVSLADDAQGDGWSAVSRSVLTHWTANERWAVSQPILSAYYWSTNPDRMTQAIYTDDVDGSVSLAEFVRDQTSPPPYVLDVLDFAENG